MPVINDNPYLSKYKGLYCKKQNQKHSQHFIKLNIPVIYEYFTCAFTT